jgi:hypothetical protein
MSDKKGITTEGHSRTFLIFDPASDAGPGADITALRNIAGGALVANGIPGGGTLVGFVLDENGEPMRDMLELTIAGDVADDFAESFHQHYEEFAHLRVVQVDPETGEPENKFYQNGQPFDVHANGNIVGPDATSPSGEAIIGRDQNYNSMMKPF